MRTSDFLGRNRRIALALAALAVLAGCASQPYPAANDPPGFFIGMFHGLLAPVSFVISIFADNRMYAFPNSGVWYDFGWLLGLSGWAGGAAAR